jgi:hypothetical protein
MLTLSRDGSAFVTVRREDVPMLSVFKTDRGTGSSLFLNLGKVDPLDRYLSINLRSHSLALGLSGRNATIVGMGKIKFTKLEAHKSNQDNLSVNNFQPGNVIITNTLMREDKMVPIGLLGISDRATWYGLDLNDGKLISDINQSNVGRSIGTFGIEATVVV